MGLISWANNEDAALMAAKIRASSKRVCLLIAILRIALNEFPQVLLQPRLATAHRVRRPLRNMTRILGTFQICDATLICAAGALPVPGQRQELC